ncbi:MAG: hypothetical protein QOD68_3619 [Actinomycetota bacterium]|jgi:hypothetical protein|nr:hypothetical protein [Actinomycetota bacterium]
MLASTIRRSVLLAPDPIARVVAWCMTGPEERWLLQSRRVRRGYAHAALAGDDERARMIWMLHQPDHVRESYVREVLEPVADRRRRGPRRGRDIRS